MFGIFPMLEAPSGNSNTELGVGKTWAKLPVWVQKSYGPWTTYGGLGEEIVPQTGYRNFVYGGWLVQRDLGRKWTLGSEVFSHGGEGTRDTANQRINPVGSRRITTIFGIQVFKSFFATDIRSRVSPRHTLILDFIGRGETRKGTQSRITVYGRKMHFPETLDAALKPVAAIQKDYAIGHRGGMPTVNNLKGL